MCLSYPPESCQPHWQLTHHAVLHYRYKEKHPKPTEHIPVQGGWPRRGKGEGRHDQNCDITGILVQPSSRLTAEAALMATCRLASTRYRDQRPTAASGGDFYARGGGTFFFFFLGGGGAVFFFLDGGGGLVLFVGRGGAVFFAVGGGD